MHATHYAGDHPKTLERLAVNLHPGGWAVEHSRPITTLLGSCVAVCLHDPVLRIGGMNHFMLPKKLASHHVSEDTILSGDFAMEVLVNAMLGRGARKERMIAKVFGGGSIVAAISLAIGERNAEFAREWLAREGIPLIASDLLGPWSRKVVWVPQTGDAFCRRMAVGQATAARLAEEERKYERSLEQAAKAPRVELF
ncbi:MAG: chemotaxis protein CheD [Zoogloea sp.]|nr:chemotaxis protein CheD [Zoogloea sp.]